jgi:hypothetical protein
VRENDDGSLCCDTGAGATMATMIHLPGCCTAEGRRPKKFVLEYDIEEIHGMPEHRRTDAQIDTDSHRKQREREREIEREGEGEGEGEGERRRHRHFDTERRHWKGAGGGLGFGEGVLW